VALAEVLPCLADVPADIQTAIGASLVRALGLMPHRQALDSAADPDFQTTIAFGYTESLEELCARISKPAQLAAAAA